MKRVGVWGIGVHSMSILVVRDVFYDPTAFYFYQYSQVAKATNSEHILQKEALG